MRLKQFWRKCVAGAFALISLVALGNNSVQATSGSYFLNPTGHNDTVIVEQGGRLWIKTERDAIARRLTRSNVEELTPAISPEGKHVAYVADAGAHLEVFVLDLASGVSERLTYEAGFNVKIQGWLSETEILFSSTRKAGKRGPLLFTVDRIAKKTHVLPLLEASEGCLLGDSFVYVKNQPLLDNIKLYKGGYAQQIYKIPARLVAETQIVETTVPPSEKLTKTYEGISRNPLCIGERLYFLTDRSGHFNIWSTNENGQDLVQHTFGKDYDIRTISSADGKTILFSKLGEVYRYDPAAEVTQPVAIALPPNASSSSEQVTLAADDAEAFRVSDDASIVLLVIRGKLWSLDTASKTTTCLECGSGNRVREIELTADSKTVLALVDHTDDYRLYAYDVAGREEPITVSHEISEPLLDFKISPNGSDILVRTIAGNLYHVETSTGKTLKVNLESRTQPEEVSWSESGRFAAFVTFTSFDISRVTIYDTVCNTVDYITSGRYEVTSPVFASGDREILLLADINFRSSTNDTWAPTSHWPSFDKKSVLHSIEFRGDAEGCLEPVNEITNPRKQPLMQELPFVAGNYDGLSVSGQSIFAFSKQAKRDEWGKINVFSRRYNGARAAAELPFQEAVERYSFSPRSTALIALGEEGIFLSKVEIDGSLSTPDYVLKHFKPQVTIDLIQEREQMFLEMWRLYRDYFWNQEMDGIDWASKYEEYRPHVKRISHQSEFNDLAGYMVGELGAGHTSLERGLVQGTSADEIAKLGADFVDRNGSVYVSSIFDGDLDLDDERSPLTDLVSPVEVGDRIVSFNGAPVRSVYQLRRMLVGKVGQSLLLEIERPDGSQEKQRVTTISSADETWLRGKAWAAKNAQLTDQLSNGRVGYIHMTAAYADDFADFVRKYSYLHKRDALILDLRGNSGGNVDPWLLHFLQRRTWLYVKDRYDDLALKHPRESLSGNLYVLIDGDTYSDGELIAEGVRQLDLGVLVGTRTTGAGIWVNDDRKLIDGSSVRIPVSISYLPGDEDQNLVIEGRGVEPDIVIENDPYLFFHGKDSQLIETISTAVKRSLEEKLPH